MIGFLKGFLSVINPIGALREKNDLLTFKNSELTAENVALKAEVEILRKKDTANTEEIKKLNNLLHQRNSFETNAVNPQGVPYRSAAPRSKP